MVSNSLIAAARSRVSVWTTARFVSPASAFSTMFSMVSWVFVAWSLTSFALSSSPKGAILLKFVVVVVVV